MYYAYDSLNRLTNITDWVGRQTSYTYDLDSRVKTLTRPNGTIRAIGYDVAGQTTNIYEYGPNPLTAIAFFNLSWNAAGRIGSEFAAPLPHAYTPPTRTNGYDADDRLTSFNGQTIVNDNNGNMTSGPLTNNTLTTYGYDARNRLTGVAGILLGPPTLNYAYDAANNRIAITNGSSVTTYVVDPKTSQVLMRIKGGTTNYYVYGLGLVYEEDDTPSGTTTLTYHYDYRGSTVALTDGNGNVTDRMEYSAYGVVSYRAGTNDTPFLYNGRYGVQTDANGLLYMRNRYYNPYICRFINQDPSGFNGGLNLYAYANGDPISMMDPFGLGAVGENSGFSWVNAVAKGIDATWNFGITALFTPQPEGATPEQIQAMAQNGVNAFGSPMKNLFGIDYGASPMVDSIAPGMGPTVMNAANAYGVGSLTAKPSPEIITVNTLQANRAAGAAWESYVINNQLPLTQNNVQPQITIQSAGPSGLSVRLDAVGTIAASGAIGLTDAKASANAPLTPNQKIVYPELPIYGGTVVGAGKPPYVGGTVIPPTSVNIIRPQ